MQKTSNYQLNQWEPTDPIRREEFNADNAAIDAAIKAVVDGQASISQSIAALTTALGSGGYNCRIAWGSYTGNGKTGSSNPTKLTFDFCPVAVIVGNINGEVGSGGTYFPGVLMRPAAQSVGDSGKIIYLTWGSNYVKWYDADGYASLNETSTTYAYVALGYTP